MYKQITLTQMIEEVENERRECSKMFSLAIITYVNKPTDKNKKELIYKLNNLHKLIKVNN